MRLGTYHEHVALPDTTTGKFADIVAGEHAQQISAQTLAKIGEEPALPDCAPSLLTFKRRASDFPAPAVRRIAAIRIDRGQSVFSMKLREKPLRRA